MRPGEARFGPELDGEKLWRDQARKKGKNIGENYLCSIRIQKQRLAPKVRPGEARFGPELDGEKLWRDQVFETKLREKKGETLEKTIFVL